MKALVLKDQSLSLTTDHPLPEVPPGWARIRVRMAGICRTDLELVRGYMGFQGVLGHEFVGEVDACDDPDWVGRRVVGEINAACGTCDWCDDGLGRHCPERSVLGILGLDGCMAEYCCLPTANLHTVPERMSDEQAVFVEPLSAAYEILDQVELTGFERCIVLGDGKLGILCAWVLSTVLPDVTLVGRHSEKLEAAAWGTLRTAEGVESVEPGAELVIDATGSGPGLADAMQLCRPRGTLVLKSTLADPGDLNLAPIVIDELTVVGSRCGPFEHGLAGQLTNTFPLERLIASRYPLEDGLAAFELAAQRGVLKVLVEMGTAGA
jgi:alcohol dehydrogenase